MNVKSREIAEVTPPSGIVATMAAQYGMDAKRFEQTLRATVCPSNTTPEQFAAFLLVAKRYGLNPLVKEIYAFPGKGGGIQPIVSIDGWLRIMNDHPQMDGIEFHDQKDEEGALVAITARIFRKDRAHATEVTEYMDECRLATQTWKQWPARMLRHKAAIQAARYAFGFSGIVDPDEAERMALAGNPTGAVEKSATAALKARLAPPAALDVFENAPAEAEPLPEIRGTFAPRKTETIAVGGTSTGEVDLPTPKAYHGAIISDVPAGDPSQPTGKE